jgi:hypothetical protein
MLSRAAQLTRNRTHKESILASGDRRQEIGPSCPIAIDIGYFEQLAGGNERS